MRCGGEPGCPWTAVRVRELRERVGIAEFDPSAPRPTLISADEAARQLSIGVGSVYQLIRDGVLPGTQLMPAAPWQIPSLRWTARPFG